MSSPVFLSLVSVLAVSVLSLIGIMAFALKERLLCQFLLVSVSLAAGALLGDAFLHLIPEAFAEVGEFRAPLLILSGFLFFFVIERFLHWHHTHGDEKEETVVSAGGSIRGIHPTGYLVLVSDGLHNLLDGIIIGASYLAGTGIGIATTLAIILHEIPQEIGDFGVLMRAGFSRSRALFLNFLSALLALAGATLALLAGSASAAASAVMLPFAAGGFIYIAAADLVPELHKTRGTKRSVVEFLALLLGVFSMVFLLFLERV